MNTHIMEKKEKNDYFPQSLRQNPSRVSIFFFNLKSLIAALWVHICTQNIKEMKINIFLWDNWETEKNSREGCLII